MSSWADRAIEELKLGKDAVIYPKGGSMKGLIESGERVFLTQPTDLEAGTIVLVRVAGNVYLHLIKEVKDSRYLIGNNKGGINGWVDKDKIYGKVKSIG